MLSTTYNAHRSEVADAISNHNALWRRLSKKGRKRTEDGGATIVEPIAYQGPGTYQRYTGFAKLNVGARDSITSATYPWRQCSISMALSGSSMRRNQGKAQAVRLVKTVLEAARSEMANGLSGDIYSDGAAAEQINGLQALVSDAGTGTVGDINSTNETWWKSKVQSAAAPLQGGGAITPSSTTIQSLMLPLYLALTRGGDHPDIIVSADNYYTFYEESLTALKMYTDSSSAQGGFLSLKYRAADVFHDTGGGCPASRMYFITSDNMDLVTLRGADLDLTEELHPVDQDAVARFILFEGNLTTNNRARHGVLKP
jgi:hypothetical protein